MSVKHCFTQIILIYICLHQTYDIQCPHTSHWNLRAYQDCNETSKYYCLFDENTFMYTEFCRRTPDFEGPGFKVVVLGSLNGKMCAPNRYQPYMFWTNGSSECTFQKSLCSGEGQVIVIDNLTRKDTTCRCNYRRGFSFVIQPRHITYCVPSKEDCSCYNKQCLGGYILNADYQCVTGSHNGSTTSDPTISSENKSTEIFVKTVIPISLMRMKNRILVLTCISSMLLTVISIFLVSFCLWNREKHTDSCTRKIELQRIPAGVNEETAVLQPFVKETDTCSRTGTLELHHNPAGINEETVVLQPFVKKQQMHLEYIKRGTVSDSFVLTKAFRWIYDTVRKNKVTVISGPPGCGKTVMSYQAALKLKEADNYDIVFVSKPWQFIASLNENSKQVFVIDDIVGKYYLNDRSLQTWGMETNVINYLLHVRQGYDIKLIVTCRSYIYRNERFRLLNLPDIHCDMLADEMFLTAEERRLICRCLVSVDEMEQLHDDIIMLYNFFPLICTRYKEQVKKTINEYFLYPNDILEKELNELRLSSDPCFIALGLLVICNNTIDKRSLVLYDHTEITAVIISEILMNMLQDIDYECFISPKSISSSLSHLENMYVKETFLTFTCINKFMFNMLVGTVGRYFIPCILKHGNSELIKDYIELSQFSTDQNPCTIKIESQYENLYVRRIIDDISNGFNWDVFDTVQMKREDYQLYFIEKILKTKMPSFCKSKKDGSTPLHVTALLGYNDISLCLVEIDKSQVNSRDNTGKTPLHMACSKGNTAVAKILIKSNAEVNQMDTNKVTPFMLACSSGNIELIKFLLPMDVHINAFNSLGFTPLLEACIKNNVKACSLLLENKAKVDCFNKNGDTPLHLACQAGQTEILNLLIKYDIDTCINRPNVKGYTPFYLAISNGHKKTANKIIKHGADPNYQNENGATPLHIACETNQLEIVKTLLEQYHVELNKNDNKGRTPLDVSKIHKLKDISDLLIERQQIDKTLVNIPITSTSTC